VEELQSSRCLFDNAVRRGGVCDKSLGIAVRIHAIETTQTASSLLRSGVCNRRSQHRTEFLAGSGVDFCDQPGFDGLGMVEIRTGAHPRDSRQRAAFRREAERHGLFFAFRSLHSCPAITEVRKNTCKSNKAQSYEEFAKPAEGPKFPDTCFFITSFTVRGDGG